MAKREKNRKAESWQPVQLLDKKYIVVKQHAHFCKPKRGPWENLQKSLPLGLAVQPWAARWFEGSQLPLLVEAKHPVLLVFLSAESLLLQLAPFLSRPPVPIQELGTLRQRSNLRDQQSLESLVKRVRGLSCSAGLRNLHFKRAPRAFSHVGVLRAAD